MNKIKALLIELYFFPPFAMVLSVIYYLTGKKPWSMGYLAHRNNLIIKLIDKELPQLFGVGCDERVVEYPWILSKVKKSDKYILDAGSLLNYDYILDQPALKDKKIIIANLNPELTSYNSKGVSYIYADYGDLRHLPLKDSLFDLIICGSVIEHIGMDNQKVYSNKVDYNEKNTKDYLFAVREFYRLLKPRGRCLITVPFGKPQKLTWLQQFDRQMVAEIMGLFTKSDVSYYQYTKSGWFLSTYENVKDSSYYDIRSNVKPLISNQAAAGAVALIELHK